MFSDSTEDVNSTKIEIFSVSLKLCVSTQFGPTKIFHYTWNHYQVLQNCALHKKV